jgi:HSP20 family protein
MIRDLVPVLPRSISRLNDRGLVSFRDAIDRMFDSVVNDFDYTMSGNTLGMDFTPRLEMDDKGDEIILSAELPGLTDKDVQVELNKDMLTIRGEKKSHREEKSASGYFNERGYGSFERTIRLPSDVLKDKIDAAVKDGILTVTLPKSHEAKKEIKKIAVHH